MSKDLTQGRITPLLIKFTIPLILGNIFQLTYNAVDSIIVGQFVGTDAVPLSYMSGWVAMLVMALVPLVKGMKSLGDE